MTTSYRRHAGDPAGTFVHDAVEAVRARGVRVTVVSPADVRHYGIAYGAGIPQDLGRAPWKAAFVPLFLASSARAARRAARDADLVHAHWLPSGLAALSTGKPYVVQIHGTDAEQTGLLVPPSDPAALRAALERLLGDGELRRRLGEAGRRLAEERLGLDAAADALVAAYADALRVSI